MCWLKPQVEKINFNFEEIFKMSLLPETFFIYANDGLINIAIVFLQPVYPGLINDNIYQNDHF